jgi:Arc/MetJ-type ribon-helix-helix transcriptional regulator
MTNVIRSASMADKAISVRLDAEAQRALASLMRGGVSQSEAIRAALLAASRGDRYDRMAADAKRLADDPQDQALIAEIRDFFDEG